MQKLLGTPDIRIAWKYIQSATLPQLGVVIRPLSFLCSTDLEEADAQPQAPEGDIAASQGAEGDKAAEEAGTSEAEEGEPDELSDPRKDAEAQQTKRNACAFCAVPPCQLQPDGLEWSCC